MEELRERPLLFKLGVGLSALQSLALLGLVAMAAVVGSLGLLAALGEARRFEDALPLLLLGLLGTFGLAFACFLALAFLLVCWRAWRYSRPAIWGVMVLSGLFILFSSGFPPVLLLGVLTIVGCAQMLERMSPARGGTPVADPVG